MDEGLSTSTQLSHQVMTSTELDSKLTINTFCSFSHHPLIVGKCIVGVIYTHRQG